MTRSKYPYRCTFIDKEGRMHTFVPILIDYEKGRVWRKNTRASGNGEWMSFEDVKFHINSEFKHPASCQ